MVQNINQFSQTADQGDADLQPGFVVSCKVDSAFAGTAMVAGQAVKLTTTAGGVPNVTAITSNTDAVFGFIARNLKDASYVANERLEIAIQGTVMYMTANAAITRGADVEIDYSTSKVAPYGGVNPLVGMALDTATADGSLIRVLIATPSHFSGGLKTVEVTATLAEINAGKVLIPGVAGKQIRVANFIERVTGAFTTTTSVDVQSDATAVKVAVSAVAGLTNGAVIIPGTANTTLGAGFGTALPVGEGVKVANVGTAAAGGTSIKYTITYAIV